MRNGRFKALSGERVWLGSKVGVEVEVGDQCMASYKNRSSERIKVMEAGAEGMAGVGAGGERRLSIS